MSSPFTAMTLRLADQQHWRCIYCEFEMGRDDLDGIVIAFMEAPRDHQLIPGAVERAALGIRVSFDHFVPRSLHGPDTDENGIAACTWCNRTRHSDDAIEFKARIVALLARRQHPRQIFRATGRWPVAHADAPHVHRPQGSHA